MNNQFAFACPVCRTPLERSANGQFLCPKDQAVYQQEEGIWRFLPAPLAQPLEQFIKEYRYVRREEGRGSGDPAFYRDLPFQDRTGRYTFDWEIRAASYQAFLSSLMEPLEDQFGNELKIVDLGAGNGWLSNRLALRGHLLAAVDLQTNDYDGLGAHSYFDSVFLPLQADFNHLPLQDSQADLVIFNASFHYSTNYAASLKEALRVLKPGGQVVILDSPIYQDANSGAAMVHEREKVFKLKFGFPSNAISSENYLTYKRLNELGRSFGIHWRLIDAYYGLAWAMRPIRARLAGKREPAQFRIAAGRRVQ